MVYYTLRTAFWRAMDSSSTTDDEDDDDDIGKDSMIKAKKKAPAKAASKKGADSGVLNIFATFI